MAFNVLAMLGAGCWAEILLGRRFFYLVLIIGLPIISLGVLILEPKIIEYRGASGLVVAYTCALALELMRTLPLWGRWVVGFGGVVALGLHFFSISFVFPNLLMDTKSAWSSHLMGGGVGCLIRFVAVRRG